MAFTINALTGQFDIVGGGGISIGQTVAGADPYTVLVTNGSSQLEDVGSLTDGQLVIGSTGNTPIAASLTGTSNQITVTAGAGSITLSLPQDIAVSSTPTFNGLLLEETGAGTDVITLQAPASILASYTLTLPVNDGAADEVLSTDGSGVLSWVSNGPNTIGTIDSQTKSANGAVIVGTSFYLQTADATYPGLVSTGSQIFAGNKQFNGYVYADGGIDHSTLGGTLAIGTNNALIINLGNASSTINFNGTVNNNNVTNLNVADQLITINDGGGAGSASGAGFEIEENALITGYFKTSADRNSFELKAPNTTGIITLTPGASGFTIDQGSHNPVTVTDTNSINLTVTTQDVSADLRISANAEDVGYVIVTNNIESTGSVGLRSQVQITALTTALGSIYVNVSGDTMTGTLVLTEATAPLTLNSAAITATRPLKVDGSKNVVTGLIDLASSNDVTGTLPVANGGTNSSTALNSNRIMVSSAGAIVEAAALTDGQLLIGDTGGAPVAAALTGTTNQIAVTNGAGSITLSTPQDIATTSSPDFASLTLSDTTNQLFLGTTNITTISSVAPSASRVVTLPDAGTDSSFVLTESAQTINGIKTFGATPLLKTALDIEDPGVSTNKITIQAPTLGASYTLTLPVDDGAANQALKTNGSGVLSWATVDNATDIQETAFTNATNVATNEDITGLVFSNAAVRSFEALISVVIDATADLFATYKLYGIQRGSDWQMTSEYVGDITGVVFNITTSGQVQYSKPSTAGHTLTSIKFRAETLSV